MGKCKTLIHVVCSVDLVAKNDAESLRQTKKNMKNVSSTIIFVRPAHGNAKTSLHVVCSIDSVAKNHAESWYQTKKWWKMCLQLSFVLRPFHAKMQNASLRRYCELGHKVWGKQNFSYRFSSEHVVFGICSTRESVSLCFIENNDLPVSWAVGVAIVVLVGGVCICIGWRPGGCACFTRCVPSFAPQKIMQNGGVDAAGRLKSLKIIFFV